MTEKKAMWQADLGVFIFLSLFFLIIYALGQMVTPFILAAIFASVLNPFVNRLSRRRIPKLASTIVLAVLLFAVLVALMTGIVLVLMREVPQFISRVPAYLDVFKREYLPRIQSALHIEAPINPDALIDSLKKKLTEVSPESYGSAVGSIVRVASGTINVALSMLALLLIPILMIYMMLDWDNWKKSALDIMPRAYRDDMVAKLLEVKAVLGSFIKGQLLVSMIIGCLYSLGLFFVGIDAPILIGVGAGFGNIIPLFGTVTGITISVVLALLKFHDVLHPLLAFLVFLVVEIFNNYFLIPRVMGNRLGLNPVVIILSLLVFGKIFGFVGILLAVPIAAVLKVFLTSFIKSYRDTKFYTTDKKAKP